MPEEENTGKAPIEEIPAPRRRKIKLKPPYTFSGVAKFFLIMGAVVFFIYCLYLLLQVYIPPKPPPPRFGYVYRVIKPPAQVRISVIIFFAESIVFVVLTVVALIRNKMHYPTLDERVFHLSGIARFIMGFLAVFLLTCIGVALYTRGQLVMLPGGGTFILFFVLRSEMKNWRLGRELAEKRVWKRAAGEPPASAPAAGPLEKVPLAAPGSFVRPQKADLKAAKARYAKLVEGPVKKLPLDRFAKKSRISLKIVFAIVCVVIILVVLFFVFSRVSSIKTHPAYIKARNLIEDSWALKDVLGVPPLSESASPTIVYGKYMGHQIADIENKISGTKAKGSFKARAVYFKNRWQLVRLEVIMDGGVTKLLINRELTPTGFIRRDD